MNRAALTMLPLLACGGGRPDATVGAPTPVALGTDEAAGRSFRRMDIDQLSASLELVTGGIGWSEYDEVESLSSSLVEVDLFEHLSLTLGKPDYLDSTVEDLSAGLLFQKFLDDAAKSACGKLVESEPGRIASERTLLMTVEADTTLASDPDAVAENVSAALLRYHGRKIEPEDPRIQPWATLFDDVTNITGDPMEGWRAVCVALITHPDFYSY